MSNEPLYNDLWEDFEGYTPRKFCERIREEQYVSNQDAVKCASLILYNHIQGRPSVNLFAAPSGSGKSFLWQTLQKICGNHKILIIDSTKLSLETYKGDVKLSGILQTIPYSQKRSVILVFDEADKILEPQIGSGGTDYRAMIQNEFLALCNHDAIYLGKDEEANAVYCDTSGISVVFLGAFERIMKSKSRNSGSIGFGRKQRVEYNYANSEITIDDLVEFGMRPELAGRINRITSMSPLSVDTLCSTAQNYIQKTEQEINAKIDVDYNVIFHLATMAQEKGLGARYINSRIMNILDDQIYENPHAERYVINFKSLDDSYFRQQKNYKELTL